MKKKNTNMSEYKLEENDKGIKMRDMYSNHVIAEFKGLKMKELKKWL